MPQILENVIGQTTCLTHNGEFDYFPREVKQFSDSHYPPAIMLPCDRPISLLPISTCGVMLRALFAEKPTRGRTVAFDGSRCDRQMNITEVFKRIWNSRCHRCQFCIQTNVENFQQYLQTCVDIKNCHPEI